MPEPPRHSLKDIDARDRAFFGEDHGAACGPSRISEVPDLDSCDVGDATLLGASTQTSVDNRIFRSDCNA